MNYLKIILFLVALSATGSVLSSCGNNSSKTEKQGKEYTSAYICQMHCEGSGSDQAVKCPVCGMDYVKNEKHRSDGQQDDAHEGHSH